jgi:hypothetical protein
VAKCGYRAQLLALAGRKLNLEDGREILGEKTLKTIMDTTYRPDYPDKHKEFNEHGAKLPKEGQEDPVQFRSGDSTRDAGIVRMTRIRQRDWPSK